MNRIELKKIISGFNSVSNRLLQSNILTYYTALKKFVNYIESTEMIMNFINCCGGYNSAMEKEVNDVVENFGFRFDDYIDDNEETANIYSILKVICTNNYDGFPIGLLNGYNDYRDYNEIPKEFNHQVIYPFIDHIENYLTKVGIDMGLDGNVTYNINGNQVNIANDNATINATQNNGVDADKLKELINEMRNSLSDDLPDDDKQTAIESIDAIETELQSDAPNEKAIKTHFKLLKKIDSSVKFASACCSIATFANKLYPFLDQIALMFQG